ncbi:MAG TPA: glycosyltransferase family 2 protein [Kofleriaceae bacterium]|jgi:glycosyltransferase involved in cell wall biosynthesis|nr:glycosyltransferase family 2 protein [Kofleriaceae bacterium]
MTRERRPRTLEASEPRVSVVVRSYNRLPALAELLEVLLAQDHDSFEVVVIEQTPVRARQDVARLDELTRDPRIRMFRHPPLGGPRARNVGVRSARGDLLVFIDDDDLPASTDWLRRHEANFADPRCLGVTGQFIDDGPPYVNMAKARRQVLSFNLLKWQRVYTRTDQRKRVESLMGGNAAIRRQTLERFGLWDECTPIEDEPSLAYRINAGKHHDEYLRFDPEAKMIRRLDVPGGMAKRMMSGPVYAKRVFTFLHNIIGHYFPVRFALLYPLYIYLVAYHVIQWICSDSKKHQTLSRRIWAVSGLCLSLLPLWTVWLVEWWYLRIRDGELAHRPELSPKPLPKPSLNPSLKPSGAAEPGDLGELVSAPSRVA